MKLQSLNLCPLLRQMGKIREAEVINRMQRVRLQHARVIRGGGTAILSGHTKEPSGHTQVNTRSPWEWQWRWRLRLQRLRTLLRTADTWRKCCCVRMQTCAGRVSRILLSIRVSHLLHVYRLFLHWMTPENAVVFQSSKENRPQKMPARPLEAKIVLVEQNSRLTLGSPSNNVKKSFVRWASYCGVCGPPVKTERPARALKKKGVKKAQPVWLQGEQKREPVWLWLLPTFVNSFWLNSFLNTFPNSFWMPCKIGSFSTFDVLILMLLFLVPLYLFGHLCGGPPSPAVVPVLCQGFRG